LATGKGAKRLIKGLLNALYLRVPTAVHKAIDG